MDVAKITDYLDSQTDAIQRFAAKLGESTHPKEDDLAAIREGDWKRAHESAQQDEGPEGSWMHAYLHRKEGDQGNAAYWYGRGSQACLPGASGCGMAQHCGRVAGIDRPILSGLRIMTRHLMFFDSEPSMTAESIVVCRRAVVRPDHAED